MEDYDTAVKLIEERAAKLGIEHHIAIEGQKVTVTFDGTKDHFHFVTDTSDERRITRDSVSVYDADEDYYDEYNDDITYALNWTVPLPAKYKVGQLVRIVWGRIDWDGSREPGSLDIISKVCPKGKGSYRLLRIGSHRWFPTDELTSDLELVR